MPNPFDILYEDNDCIVINKPAGLAVQGGKGVKVSLDDILAKSRSPRPLLVHRLDKDTSGLILVAKNREAAAMYSRLFREGHAAADRGADGRAGIVKRYLAVCAGIPAQPSGSIRLDLEVRGSMKQSETRYRLLQSAPGQGAFSLLELELETGRMHQIRRHLALCGTPIAGDDKYGDFSLNKQLRKTMNLRRLLLHASHLILSGGALDIQAPLPDYFSAFLEQAGMGDSVGGILTGLIR